MTKIKMMEGIHTTREASLEIDLKLPMETLQYSMDPETIHIIPGSVMECSKLDKLLSILRTERYPEPTIAFCQDKQGRCTVETFSRTANGTV